MYSTCTMYVHVTVHVLYNRTRVFVRSEMPELGDVRIPDKGTVPGIDEDNGYSVFISYVEIYNNFVYDLLEEPTPEAILHPK